MIDRGTRPSQERSAQGVHLVATRVQDDGHNVGRPSKAVIDSYYRHGNTRCSMDRVLRKRTPPLTPAVFHILLALADGPRHGYAVMQAVERSADAEPPMGPGTIYGSLQRMEEAGLVREIAAPADDRRRRFPLLPAGGGGALPRGRAT